MNPTRESDLPAVESPDVLTVLLMNAQQLRDRILSEIGKLRRSQPKPGRAQLHRWTVEYLLRTKQQELDRTDAQIRDYRERLVGRHHPSSEEVMDSLAIEVGV